MKGTPRLIGYFPKRIRSATPAMKLPGVTEVWSVSNCISTGPEGWIGHWRHNELGVFGSPELARSVVPDGERDSFAILAYRLWPEEFDAEGSRPIGALEDLEVEAIPRGYRVIGYDAVSASSGQFECSPLSCNGAAAELETNSRCLMPSLKGALDAALRFARGSWEPGPYRVVEVLALESGARLGE